MAPSLRYPAMALPERAFCPLDRAILFVARGLFPDESGFQ